MKKKTRSELLKEINDMKKICKNCEYYNIASKNTISEWGVCLNKKRRLFEHSKFVYSTDVCALFSEKLPDKPENNLIEIDTTKDIIDYNELTESYERLTNMIKALVKDFKINNSIDADIYIDLGQYLKV